ncbi:LacI family DNA-binding transcriptional regulator [Marinomonas spartinae]|uniref:LacI family DNA-binding transcriptional regulator n=1 Tax=Marinomonas spartinae TaxID=1792290 RepID=UPI0018F1C509|nr:LacI family DNA-binding transcriptional regulator [Marinomonas spartinae]MBJ7555902.1 LacI family DNA-binding transcriptional regulator [Marinomonas spartinae]
MSTISEVAKKAGVSNATVSRVLSGAARVREETRNRVMEAIDTLSYVPNQAARSLASNKTFTVGLVASNIDNIYYGPAAGGVEKALRKADRHAIIASGNDSLSGEREAVDFLIKRQVDALVLVTRYMSEEELAEINRRCPVFVMNQHFDGDHGRNIAFDNFSGGKMAIQYLLDQGHRRIAIVRGPKSKSDASQRYLGSLQAMEAAGLALTYEVEGDFTIESGVKHMQSILRLGERPTAVFLGNDLMAIGALHVCNEHKVKVPEDIAIIGFDDTYLARYTSPSLTTIQLPLFDMANATAKLLLNTIYDCQYDVQTLFSPKLVCRKSA